MAAFAGVGMHATAVQFVERTRVPPAYAAENRKALVQSETRTRRLVLEDATGRARASLTTGADGSPALQMADMDGRARVRLILTRHGPRLEMLDKKGVRRLMALLDANDQPQVYLKGPRATQTLISPTP